MDINKMNSFFFFKRDPKKFSKKRKKLKEKKAKNFPRNMDSSKELEHMVLP
jgi:hypothetical protein